MTLLSRIFYKSGIKHLLSEVGIELNLPDPKEELRAREELRVQEELRIKNARCDLHIIFDRQRFHEQNPAEPGLNGKDPTKKDLPIKGLTAFGLGIFVFINQKLFLEVNSDQLESQQVATGKLMASLINTFAEKKKKDTKGKFTVNYLDYRTNFGSIYDNSTLIILEQNLTKLGWRTWRKVFGNDMKKMQNVARVSNNLHLKFERKSSLKINIIISHCGQPVTIVRRTRKETREGLTKKGKFVAQIIDSFLEQKAWSGRGKFSIDYHQWRGLRFGFLGCSTLFRDINDNLTKRARRIWNKAFAKNLYQAGIKVKKGNEKFLPFKMKKFWMRYSVVLRWEAVAKVLDVTVDEVMEDALSDFLTEMETEIVSDRKQDRRDAKKLRLEAIAYANEKQAERQRQYYYDLENDLDDLYEEELDDLAADVEDDVEDDVGDDVGYDLEDDGEDSLKKHLK